MPETAFLGGQIAPKSLSAGAYSAPPGPLAGLKGPYSFLRLLLLRVGEGEEKKGGEGRTPKNSLE